MECIFPQKQFFYEDEVDDGIVLPEWFERKVSCAQFDRAREAAYLLLHKQYRLALNPEDIDFIVGCILEQTFKSEGCSAYDRFVMSMEIEKQVSDEVEKYKKLYDGIKVP